MRTYKVKEKYLKDAAMWFAELGEVPNTYAKVLITKSESKPTAVIKRYWKRYWKSWGGFIHEVKKHHQDLIDLTEPQKEAVSELPKDPLEALRASTTEK